MSDTNDPAVEKAHAALNDLFTALNSDPRFLAAEIVRLRADRDRLLKALRYARRFLNTRDHDTAFVDSAINNDQGPRT